MKAKKSKYIFIIATLTFALLLNEAVYYLGKIIPHGMTHHDMTLPMDLIIPVIPFTVVIYIVSFLVWLVCYTLILSWDGWEGNDLRSADTYGPKEFFDNHDNGRFLAADALAKVICFVFFIVYPTHVIRPEIGDSTIWEQALSFLYQIDTAEDLFPSIHCLVSWMCWIGLRKRHDVHPVIRHLPLVLAIVICISTLTTKQHVILDVPGGILLAELTWWLAGLEGVRKIYEKPMGRLLSALQGHIK